MQKTVPEKPILIISSSDLHLTWKRYAYTGLPVAPQSRCPELAISSQKGYKLP